MTTSTPARNKKRRVENMKKLSLIFTITCILVLAAAGTAYADKVYTEGLLQYTIDKNDNITIVRYSGGADEEDDAGDSGADATGDPDTYTVPWKIGNREVTNIKEGAFSKSDVGTVLIPEGVQVADGALRPDQTSESYKLVEEPTEPEHTDVGNPEWILPDIIRPGEMNLSEDTLTPNGRSVDLTVTESSEDIGIDYEGDSSAASGSGGAAGGSSAYVDGGPGVQDTDIPVAENISVEIASDAEGGPEEKDIILADDDWEDDAPEEPVKKIAAADGEAAAGETAAAAEQSAGSETEEVEVSAEPAGKAAGTGRTVTAALIIAGVLAAGAAAVLFIRKRR